MTDSILFNKGYASQRMRGLSGVPSYVKKYPGRFASGFGLLAAALGIGSMGIRGVGYDRHEELAENDRPLSSMLLPYSYGPLRLIKG